MIQSLSCVWLFVTPWTVACPASLSITNFWRLLELMSIELVIPSNHLILGCPLLFLPSIFPSTRIFSSESALHIKWPKYWSFSFSISPSSEYSGLISFRMDWLDLLAVQGTLKSFLQYHSSKALILWCSAFIIPNKIDDNFLIPLIASLYSNLPRCPPKFFFKLIKPVSTQSEYITFDWCFLYVFKSIICSLPPFLRNYLLVEEARSFILRNFPHSVFGWLHPQSVVKWEVNSVVHNSKYIIFEHTKWSSSPRFSGTQFSCLEVIIASWISFQRYLPIWI